VLGAPLGGGLFAVELLSADTIEYGCLFPAIVASAVGAGIGRMLGVQPIGWDIATGSISAGDMRMVLLAVLVVAVLAGLWGIGFVELFRRATAIKHRMPYWLGPILGAGICVACAMTVRQPGLLGTSAPLLRDLFEHPGTMGLAVCCGVLVGKSLATISTIGGGGNAGLTSPMFVVGASLGAVCAGVLGLSGAASQLVVAGGAAAMLSAVLNVPIASAVICIELFGADCSIAVALGSAVGFAVAKTEVVYSYWETKGEQ
jgi:CIC family chloride channel protein